MDRWLRRVRIRARFRASRNERGANLAEYALLIGFVAIVAIVSVYLLGRGVSQHYSDATSSFQ